MNLSLQRRSLDCFTHRYPFTVSLRSGAEHSHRNESSEAIIFDTNRTKQRHFNALSRRVSAPELRRRTWPQHRLWISLDRISGGERVWALRSVGNQLICWDQSVVSQIGQRNSPGPRWVKERFRWVSTICANPRRLRGWCLIISQSPRCMANFIHKKIS